VNSLARLSSAGAMEETIVRMGRQGKTDREIAEHLTRQGHRSPRGPVVLVSTVQIIRLRHRLLVNRSQSHPRRIPGHLTVSQVAERLQVSKHWIYDRIHNGTIEIERNPETKLFLFKKNHVTLKLLDQLKAGKAQKVRL
jgi:excisionase family DNA binding protein